MSELDDFRDSWIREVGERQSLGSRSVPVETAGPSTVSVAESRLVTGSEIETSDMPVEVISSRDFMAHRPKDVFINEDLNDSDLLALEKFEAAVDMEHCGSFADAVTKYREAFQINDRVDKLYREKYFSTAAKSVGGPDLRNSRSLDKNKDKDAGDDAQLQESLYQLDINDSESNFSEMKSDKRAKGKVMRLVKPHELTDPEACPIMDAPSEIIIEVMEILAGTDLPSFVRFMAVNKRMENIARTTQSIWRVLCMLNYSQQIYDSGEEGEGGEAEEAEDVAQGAQLDGEGEDHGESHKQSIAQREDTRKDLQLSQEELVNKYWKGSWKLMFEQRPYIRFNGVYISTCTYLRHGLYSGWSTPVQMITYYRYARFYPDGSCICLLTSLPPIEVVPQFHKQTVKMPTVLREDGSVLQRPKGIVSGVWKLKNLEGELFMETEGSVDRYTFFMNLSIKSSGSRRHNKLKWIKFWSVNKLTGDEGEFSLKNDKAYYFVRTKR